MGEPLQLPPLDEADSVATLICRLRDGLRFPPKKDFNDEYCRTRSILRRHPLLKHDLPEFLGLCKTVEDYTFYMQQLYEKEFEWDSILGNSLEQLVVTLNSTTSLDPYIMRGELGWGGFGRVYLAKHKMTDRMVAIKFFQPAFHEGGGSAIARFYQEATMLFSLNHPNIVTVRDVAMYKERPFIVMDYFDGTTLNDALRSHGRMPPDKAVTMAEAVTHGMKHAHEKNIVHRDVKPSNIMLKPNDCRIIDFGLGVYIEEQLLSRLTRTGESPAGGHYTARELIADPKNTSPQCDIYSIGAVWYTAVTNDAPAGSNLQTSLAEIPGLPQKHQDIILRCLADAEHRYHTCDELLEAIREEPNS